jgi:lipopolysaccharide heptosyltransferase I
MARVGRVPLHEYDAKRIALIKPSALGDVIHGLPVLRALRRRYPDAYIAWVINRGYQELLEGQPDLDTTIPFDRGASRVGLRKAALNYASFFQLLRKQRFDLAVDLQGLFRSALMVAATGAQRRVGLASAREGASWFYTDIVAVPDYETMHAVDRYWLVAEALGVEQEPKRFHLAVPEQERIWTQAFLTDCPRPWMFFGVGSRWVTKQWPPRHFAELASRAQATFGGTALFVGGRDEMPLAQKAAAGLTGPVRDLTGHTSLQRLMALLSFADVMVANDTGPLHLAAALGRPVVAPYTCTKVCRSGPYGSLSHAVESRVWCHGSYVKRCSRLECMTELTPDRLWPILDEHLRTWKSNCRSA